MKTAKKTILLLSMLVLLSCESTVLKRIRFENEFKSYTSGSDFVLFDGDFLHPTYAFMKNGKITGLEFNSHPECGSVIKRCYLNDDEKITKIIIEKDFWSEHCGKPFDSIFVMEIPSKSIKVYTKLTDGKIIENIKLIEQEAVDVHKYKTELKNWHYR